MSAARLKCRSGVYSAGGFAARNAPLVAGLVFAASEFDQERELVLMLNVLEMWLGTLPADVANELVDAFNDCAVTAYALTEGPIVVYVLVSILFSLLTCI